MYSSMAVYLLIFAVGILNGIFLKHYIVHILREEKNSYGKAIELVNAILYVLVFRGTGWNADGILFCICISALLAAGVIDHKTFEIPMVCSVLIGVSGCIHICMDHIYWPDYLAGMLTMALFLLAAYGMTRGRGLGGGDVKLMTAAGLLLGWEKSLIALWIASASALVFHTFLIKFKNKGRVMAFGPYLALGISFTIIYGKNFAN